MQLFLSLMLKVLWTASDSVLLTSRNLVLLSSNVGRVWIVNQTLLWNLLGDMQI